MWVQKVLVRTNCHNDDDDEEDDISHQCGCTFSSTEIPSHYAACDIMILCCSVIQRNDQKCFSSGCCFNTFP